MQVIIDERQATGPMFRALNDGADVPDKFSFFSASWPGYFVSKSPGQRYFKSLFCLRAGSHQRLSFSLALGLLQKIVLEGNV